MKNSRIIKITKKVPMLISKVQPWNSTTFNNQFMVMEMQCNISIAFTIWIFGVYKANSHETLKNVLTPAEQVEIMEIVNCVDACDEKLMTFNYRDYPNLYQRFLSTLNN